MNNIKIAISFFIFSFSMTAISCSLIKDFMPGQGPRGKILYINNKAIMSINSEYITSGRALCTSTKAFVVAENGEVSINYSMYIKGVNGEIKESFNFDIDTFSIEEEQKSFSTAKMTWWDQY